MLDGELVVAPDDAPLEEAPHALDGVRMDVGAHVLAAVVIDGLVARVLVADALPSRQLVGVDRLGVVGDVIVDEAVEVLPGASVDNLEPDLAAALRRPHHLSEVLVVALADALTLAADPRFVGFDDAPEQLLVLAHRLADSVPEEAGRSSARSALLSDSLRKS